MAGLVDCPTAGVIRVEEVRSQTEITRPASVWLATRRGDTKVHAAANDSSPIGLELTVELPQGARVSLAAMAKPLIDGTVAGFHEHDDSASLDLAVASRVGAQISVPAEEVRSLLSRNAAGILGYEDCSGHGGTASNGTPLTIGVWLSGLGASLETRRIGMAAF